MNACGKTHIFDVRNVRAYRVSLDVGCGPGGALARLRSLCEPFRWRLTWRTVCVCSGYRV